ncbi:caspase family protein [Spiribacter halobius]|uniref:caspase family protein n=1 Tax=Sediminicurvatus halobius TaxID=2182432 RepID=UPI001E3ACB1F|nr:caspase family protein [Spiribacter halobius]UEX76647.1 caspase family protein [Spiribacter halobius]
MLRHGLAALACGLLIGGCATDSRQLEEASAATEGYEEVDDLFIVDCLLPGQVRKLGTQTYFTPRRPIRTTAKDCRIRGGEYVAYDRADYRSALNVWLGRAEAGDPEAQNYVGEIFEKGLGREPDYVSAAEWYRKAAEQGYARAQINLGFLFEKGLGVEQDLATALNWYRRASGVAEDQLVYRSEYDDRLDELREELSTELERSRRQVDALQDQLERLRAERDQLQRRLEETAARSAEPAPEGDVEIGDIEIVEPTSDEESEQLAEELADARERIATLEELFTQVREERETLEARLSELPPRRSAEAPDSEPDPLRLPEGTTAEVDGIEFGRYYALIIGNQDYQYLEDLISPISDAERVRDVLEEKYGFSTIFLPNADEARILNALNDLYEQVGPKDNLLIYYAGHGSLSERERRQRGYWLPVNARRERLVHWINNSVISDHLDRIRARSILVVADSCYAGALASESSALLLPSGEGELDPETIRNGLQRRSRIVISSGGVKPVLDTIDQEHSLFARSLLEVLRRNEGILRENMLFAHVAATVRRRSEDLPLPQTPEMRPIRAAGHAGGDFYFVPLSDARES